MKKITVIFIVLGFLSLSACSPKSSQPCPHVYKVEKKNIHKNLVDNRSLPVINQKNIKYNI